MSNELPIPSGYPELFENVNNGTRRTEARAFLAVNRELVLLFGNIERDILLRQQKARCGSRIVDELSANLRREFPYMKTLSIRNIKYMQALTEARPDEQSVQQAAARIPSVTGHRQRRHGKRWDRQVSIWRLGSTNGIGRIDQAISLDDLPRAVDA
jgi:hypothetical protein